MENLEVLPVRTRVISILRNAILSGEFAPGQELSLTELSAQMGISRTPIREAFQMLEAEGLLTLRMNRGALVRGITEKTILDHYEMRELLESEAAARAAVLVSSSSAPPSFLSFLQKLQYDTEIHSPTLSTSEYREYNQQFHLTIWRAADNQKLYDMLSSLWVGPSAGRTVTDREHALLSISEHRKILDAIAAGNDAAARSLMKAHILRSKNNILKSFQLPQK